MPVKKNDVQETINEVIDEVKDAVEKTEEKSEGKFKSFGKKVKTGVKRIVDSKPFRIVTGVVSAAALAAVGVIAIGALSSRDDDGVSLLPEGNGELPALDAITDVLGESKESEVVPF